MPSSLISYLKKFDSFGEPVGVNYKGESTYKTVLGSFCTLALLAFLIFFACNSMLELLRYENPNISQVS